MRLGAILRRERHVGENILLGGVHHSGELGDAGPQLIGDLAPLPLGRFGRLLRVRVAMKAETTQRPLLPACAMALRAKCTRQRCQVALNMRDTAALMPSWASEMAALVKGGDKPGRRNAGVVLAGAE